jgi:hypothetical protein
MEDEENAHPSVLAPSVPTKISYLGSQQATLMQTVRRLLCSVLS